MSTSYGGAMRALQMAREAGVNSRSKVISSL